MSNNAELRQTKERLNTLSVECGQCHDRFQELEAEMRECRIKIEKLAIDVAKKTGQYKIIKGHKTEYGDYKYLVVSSKLQALVYEVKYVDKDPYWNPDDIEAWVPEGLRISFYEEGTSNPMAFIQADGIVLGTGETEYDAWYDLAIHHLGIDTWHF